MDSVTLHHTDTLESGAALRSLEHEPRVLLSRIDPLGLLREVGGMLGLEDRLAGLYGRLASPVMQSDLLRAAILYRQGGIYLDLDTVTVASLRPLLETGPFVGSEFIVWPRAARHSRSPAVWARHLSLDALRRASLRAMPRGWKGFRRVERFYVRGLNNAAMGACARAGLFSDYLHAMLAVPPARLSEAYALGPDLLAEVVARHARGALAIHDPAVFHPCRRRFPSTGSGSIAARSSTPSCRRRRGWCTGMPRSAPRPASRGSTRTTCARTRAASFTARWSVPASLASEHASEVPHRRRRPGNVRLREKGGLKPLIRLKGIPLIEHVIERARIAGVGEFVVVSGYRGCELRRELDDLSARRDIRITHVINENWQRANGVSVLSARAQLAEPFLLTMCDHLIDPEITRRLIARPFEPDTVTLAVDSNIANPLNDPDDVTRVSCADGRIARIGKSIADFNAIDTGAFLCTPIIFEALEESQAAGDDSISGAMNVLARRGQARVLDIGARLWVDVDDPVAFHKAELLLEAGRL